MDDVFEAHGQAGRRELVLQHVADDQLAHLELLTPEEAEFLGFEAAIPALSEDSLPLWPEALASAQHDETMVAHLPSKQFEPLAAPVVTTFYSLRGGVGRSTALAHTARHLAAQGFSVLCIDMDLEAPGLAALFSVDDRVREGVGVVSLLLQTEMSGICPDFSDDIIRVDEAMPLYLLPAGPPTAEYARQLALLDPTAWYRESINPLHAMIERAGELAQKPDVILIDSRTGISPLAAPLLFDVADMAVIAFYPHAQSYPGTRALTRALLAARSRRSTHDHPLSPEIRFLVSPVPSAPRIRAQYEEQAQEQIRE